LEISVTVGAIEPFNTLAMLLRYFGNSAFEWVGNGGQKVLIDPFQNSSWNRWFRMEMPKLQVDTVVVSHDHFDHNAIERCLGSPEVIDRPGHYRVGGIAITTVKGRHAKPQWYQWWGYGQNLVTVVESEQIRFCHWGDNADITPRLRQDLGKIDVLMLPIDESEHLLEWREVDHIIRTLVPKVVIPTHYRIREFNTVDCPLRPLQSWLRGQAVTHWPNTGIELNSKSLTELNRQVWVMEPALHVDYGFVGV